MRVVATAGHVDHGKSTLVRALTGTDPDRLTEEKKRGLTIDLGFAFTTLRSGTQIGFVDVPGHVKFLKNMLAGVGAVEQVLFVVSAREGWMPQSEEHLILLEMLGVEHGVVAVTNASAVEGRRLDEVRTIAHERLARSTLRGAAIVACDSVSGLGLDDVRVALDDMLQATPPAADVGRPRLWVDRVFAARGAGLVVTGTLAGGTVAIDDALEIARDGRRVRVRGIETAHRRVDRTPPGTRVALNLAGVEPADLLRGDALVRPGLWMSATVADVILTRATQEPLKRRARLQAHVGSGEQEVTFHTLDDLGDHARLRFTVPVALAPGDRLVLRDPGRELTVAGAEILDVDPPTSARDAVARLQLPMETRLVSGRERLAVADVPRLAGVRERDADALVDAIVASGAGVRVGDWLLEARRVEGIRARVAERVRDRDLGVDLATLASGLGVDVDVLRAVLDGDARLVIDRGIVRRAGTLGAEESPAARALVAALDATPFSPPDPDDVRLARALVRAGVLTDIAGIVFTTSAVDRARELVCTWLDSHGTVTIGDARDLLHSTRKYVVPLLEHFDREGVTRRRGDVRIAGPSATNLRQ
jgi:selenocysteine-specific elongation factor